MDRVFERRVRAAVTAGWWTVLIAMGFVTAQWVVYLLVMKSRPEWVLAMWGPGSSYATVQPMWLAAIGLLKLGVFLQAMVVLWGELWLSRLRKSAAVRMSPSDTEPHAPSPAVGAPAE